MGIMYISHLESGTVTGQTTWSQCGKSTLMCQFTQWVILIHKLGQLGASEEFLNRCSYRFNIDQGLSGNSFQILCRHSLAYNTLHTGKTDSILILKQFANSTDTTITQMVNIILVSNAILQMHIVVDGCKNILFCNMFWNQESHIFTDCFILLFFSLVFLQNFRQFRIVNFFCDSQRFFICFWQERIEIHHHIGENFLISSFFRLNKYIWNSCILNFISQFLCYKSSSLCNHLSCHRADSIFCQFKTGNSVTKSQFFVKLISSYFSQIVASHIKEHTVDEIFRTIYCQRLARTQFLVKFQQTILIVL